VGHVVNPDVARPYDEDIASGQVIDWAPKGTSPPKGAVVSLTVSAGPAPRVIPNVAGMTYDAAAAALDAKGLKAGRNPDIYTNDDASAGTVVTASPAQGNAVTRGTVVTLTVSKGRPVVPELKGLGVGDAKAKLATVGLTLGTAFGPGGTIFLTTPSSGSKVAPGSSVDVFIL
jgi:beta-lactam-binding protein with PASTA domain